MADQVIFRHPSGALSYSTERSAAEFARLNPDWMRLDSTDVEELQRPGIRCLLEIMAEVAVHGVEGRNIQNDWDKLTAAMKVRVR